MTIPAIDHLCFVAHTHWDREWYQPFQEMRARLVAMTDRMLAMVESGALEHFHFDGQTILLQDYLEVRPQNAGRLARLIQAGKIAVGPWYVLADSFLVSGEALIRNLEIGTALARRFGRAFPAGYLPDQFGHTAQMPQILSGFGLAAAVVWRGVPREVNCNRFLWEALDGTRIFTVYLPLSYANGANLPLESVEGFIRRAKDIASRGRQFAAGAPILVMNGTDHAQPDPRLAQRIAEANGKDGLKLEALALENYIARLAELPTAGLPLLRGELRSPGRAWLLPGVASARTWLKRRDFANCAALERYAGPLAALAHAAGLGDGLADWLELAWKTELQNHPHDSICGCSVDQVHEDMRHRFDEAAILAEKVVHEASRALLAQAPGGAGEPTLAVFNPTFSREATVIGEVELPEGDGQYWLLGQGGVRIPVAVSRFAPGASAFDVDLSAVELKETVAGLAAPELRGHFIDRYELRSVGAARFELDLWLSRDAASELDLGGFREEIRLRLPDSATVRIRGRAAARAALSFVAKNLEQTGFSFYRLVRDALPARSIKPAAPAGIENEFYRISPSARGLEIQDLESGTELELYFEDDGERGDEYDHDPVSGAPPLTQPTALDARVVEDSPVRRRLALSLTFAVPASLAPDRRRRSAHTANLTIELTATLYTELRRVDFETAVDNRSRDHRLRAALKTPVRAAESLSDTAFGIIRRPLAPAESSAAADTCPTAPHRTFTAIEDQTLSAALMSSGIYEVEARAESAGTTLLLTLLRCVGWLSRSDLNARRGGAGPELKTPGAQEQRTHRFEFAATTYRGGYLEADLPGRAAVYTFPPRLFATRGEPTPAGAAFLVRCDNPKVKFSTARPLAPSKTYLVRAWSVSHAPEHAEFSVGGGRVARLVDLAGRALGGNRTARRRGAALAVNLKPFAIVTLEVGERKNFRARAKKD